MMATRQRTSILNQGSLTKDLDISSRPKSKDGAKKNLWSSMLDSVASGKKLPEKNMVVLGGTPEGQKEFLELLSTDPSNPRMSTDRRSKKHAPIANQFALGYTYRDVLDADQEDILARLSIYLLSDPSPSFLPLLRPLFNSKSIPDTLVVILLDWAQPWTWIRQLRQWIRILRTVLSSVDDDAKLAMQEVMTDWTVRKRGGEASGVSSGTVLPLGPGEWDEGLGVPLCVVCQGADKTAKLEKENGWREEEFDYVLQFLRTILLKHGSSLIYSTPYLANSLQTMIHSSLGVQSTLKRQSLKHNVIDKDKILVPANWDSWGKIRIIREGFDMEGIGAAWSLEIQDPPSDSLDNASDDTDDGNEANDNPEQNTEAGDTAVDIYEGTIKDPKRDSETVQRKTAKMQVESKETQKFLELQADLIERIKVRDAEQPEKDPAQQGWKPKEPPMVLFEGSGPVNDHIGPVQFNMGGIQVDADDMVKRLKEQQATSTPQREKLATISSPEQKRENEAMKSFFAGLMNKKGTGSPRSAPPT